MSPRNASLLLLLLCCARTSAIALSPVDGDILLPVSKPGTCPAELDYPPCTVIPSGGCKKDSDCQGSLKCCVYGCQRRCVLPVSAKKGKCPPYVACPKPLPPKCHSDLQCPGTQRCCFYKCQYQCAPSVFVLPGTCPLPETKCPLTALDALCTSDDECSDGQKCCTSACQQTCTKPILLA